MSNQSFCERITHREELSIGFFMKLENVRLMLAVNNIDETVAFYRDLLGFECANRMDGWAALQRDDVEIMISLPNAHEPFEKPTLTGSLYFSTSDVDALWNQIKDKANVVYPLESFYYGMREFAIRDNNGYILQFGQEISNPEQIPPPGID
jgi:uncharacterized glyoxalase superfamily protein PhnB